LKNNKAAGDDGIVAELLKHLGPKSLGELTRIIQDIWTTEKLPESWKNALIVPLHKKGDKTDVNNYRGISLVQVTYKILSATILKRVQEQLEHKIGEYQAGFRPNRSCSEQIFNLKTILKLRHTRRQPTICTFVDFQKAYDSIDRHSLFQILDEYGLDRKTQSLIKQTLTDTTSQVKFMGEKSEKFQITTGVRQGDGLSPLLFNLALDKVMREWQQTLKDQKHWKPLKISRKKIEVSCLAFADDLAILAETKQQAIIQIENLKECAAKIGLQISFPKTKVMSNLCDLQSLKTKFGTIEKVSEFRYLGEILEPSGKEGRAQEARMQKMKRAFGRTQNVYNKKCISYPTKLRHYNAVIKPEVLYASETLDLNKKGALENILKEERKIVRKILGPKLTDDGYRLQSRTKTEQLSNLAADIRKRRLKFYGHIHRLPDHRLTKKLLEATEILKANKWASEVKQDLKNAGIKETDLYDREVYRNKVNKWEVSSERDHKKKTGAKWTEERRVLMKEKLRAAWERRRRANQE